MLKISILISILLATSLGHANGQDCKAKSWAAAKPSDEQNQKLNVITANVAKIYQSHKVAIDKAASDLLAAWKEYPISRDQVAITEALLRDQNRPVREANRDGQIDSLNLLSASQRSTYDTAFADCMKTP